MPELPEVDMFGRMIAARADGRAIERIQADPSVLSVPIRRLRRAEGRRVGTVIRHGKRLFIRAGDGFITLHFGMTGSPVMDQGARHERARITLDDGFIALDDPRKLGRIGFAPSVEGFLSGHGIGPDALEMSEEEFVREFSRGRAPAKAAIMDQSRVAGIGNLYSDEALLQSGIHPLTRLDVLGRGDLERLHRNARAVLEASIAAGSDFGSLPESFLLRDRSAGSPCPLCGRPLSSTRAAGRTSVLCQSCQPLPGP